MLYEPIEATTMITVDEFIASIVRNAETAVTVWSVHSPGRSSCLHLLSEIQARLEDQSKKIVRNSPEVTQAAEERAFRNVGEYWVDSLRAEVSGSTDIGDHIWVLLAPKDPMPSPALDCVPIEYCFTLWNRFYGYLPKRLINESGIDNRYAHAIIGDPFYINYPKHKADLWDAEDLAEITHGFAWPEMVEQDGWIGDITVRGLAEDLNKTYAMEIYAAYARALLIKEHFGMAGQRGRARIHSDLFEKRGDMLLVDIDKDPQQAPLWCKFGSPRMLHREHVNTSTLRRSPGLRPFLYVTRNNPLRDALRADYIGLLVSEHETRVDETIPLTLESFYVAYAQAMERMEPNGEITSVLSRLGKFFDALHVPGHRWAEPTAERYDILLTSRRVRWHNDESPIQRAHLTQGEYLIEFIRPRDGSRTEVKTGREGVDVYLKPRDPSTGEILVSWTSPKWRWRCWREGLVEGTPVDWQHSASAAISLAQAGDRIGSHLTNYQSALHLEGIDAGLEKRFQRLKEGLTSYLNVEIKEPPGTKEDPEIILKGVCSVRMNQLMPFDLYPHYLHGDLHPRNVLVFNPGPTKSAKVRKQARAVIEPDIKVIDLAQAVVDGDKHAPMAYDFVVLEVDAKARMVLDDHFQYAKVSDPVDLRLLADLDREEAALWIWCRENMVNCFDYSWKTSKNKARPPKTPGGRFGFVAAWRSMSLYRLRRCVVRAGISPKHKIKAIDWTPARSYAQALFLSSIAYLKFLDPEKDKMRGYACIVGASHALDVLQEAKKA